MELKKLNIQQSASYTGSRNKKSFFKKHKPIVFLLSILLFLGFCWMILSSTSSVTNFSFPINPLRKEPERINVLLLGNAGGIHDGPSLTDSIIVASYHLKSNKVTMISIPRDLWIDNTKSKINAVYEYGEKGDGGGLKAAKDAIGDILGIPVDYALRLDFSGFAKAIDLVGGIDVEVPKTFDDYNYPIEGKEDDLCGLKEEELELTEDKIKELNLLDPLPSNSVLGTQPITTGKRKIFIGPEGKIATESGNIVFNCRLEHIHYDSGLAHMDGVTALKFVRSRMGTNGEGSDFARSRRQQLIIQAFREKALAVETLINPAKVTGLVSTLGNSIDTDIPMDKYFEFYNMAKKMEQVESLVLGDLKKDNRPILITPPAADYGGAFVLVPVSGDFEELHRYLKNVLEGKQMESSSSANLLE